MARAPRPRPALARNFQVDLGRGMDGSSISQVTLPRFPADPPDEPQGPILLSRAASEDRAFHDWWEASRGRKTKSRTVTITMLAPDMSPILAWRFTGARPAALSYGVLDGVAEGVLTEMLELAFERMERV